MTNTTSDSDVTRYIPPWTRLLLAVRAGGRCQYEGCNKLLFEHHLTKEDGNFAECAHIIAFKERGTRGRPSQRPAKVHDIANLMLLCPDDHKRIDDDKDERIYTVELLEGWKRDHEQRIRYLTGLTPDLATHVVTLRARIGGHLPDAISRSAALEALRPLGLYPAERDACEIELTGSHDANPGFFDNAAAQVSRQLAAMPPVTQLAVFALAPIPLLVHLGSRISNKVSVEFFQRHRDDNSWRWREGGTELGFIARPVREGKDPKEVGLLVSISGEVELDTLPGEIDGRVSLYELRSSVPPGRDILRTKDDALRFRGAYRRVLEIILKNHGTLKKLRIFPAVPAPVGVILGYDVLPKAYPSLAVYDNVGSRGFVHALDVEYDIS